MEWRPRVRFRSREYDGCRWYRTGWFGEAWQDLCPIVDANMMMKMMIMVIMMRYLLAHQWTCSQRPRRSDPWRRFCRTLRWRWEFPYRWCFYPGRWSWMPHTGPDVQGRWVWVKEWAVRLASDSRAGNSGCCRYRLLCRFRRRILKKELAFCEDKQR